MMNTMLAVTNSDLQTFFSSANWSICTLPFMVSFIIFFVVYLKIKPSARVFQKAWVILFNIFFAAMSNGWMVLLLLFVTLLSWGLTRKMVLYQAGRKRKWMLAVSIILELLPLFCFKYLNFSLEILQELFHTNFSFRTLFIPIGISFYSFQAVSYTIDVYKGRYRSDTSLMDYAFYLTFFPLLIAGPITRAGVLLPQIVSPKVPSRTIVYHGLWLIICGLVKKCIIADYLTQYNNWVFDAPLTYSGFENLMAVIAFSLQIYCDFSGYSDLAIGVAALMGIQLKDNFLFPYQSSNLTEFWHRWHISLSTWFRDYLYIPLGGNRKGYLRTYFNNFIVMLIAGLWHGASWMFVIWGAMHGFGLVFHKLCRHVGLGKIPDTVPVRVVSWILTFSYITIAWIFFRADNIETAVSVLHQIGNNLNFSYVLLFIHARPLWFFLLALGLDFLIVKQRDLAWLEALFVRTPWWGKCFIFLIVLQLIINISQDNIQPFIYTQF